MRVKISIGLMVSGLMLILLMILPQSIASIIYGQLPSWWWDEVNSQFGRIYGLVTIITVLGMCHLIYRVAKKITPWTGKKLDDVNQLERN